MGTRTRLGSGTTIAVAAVVAVATACGGASGTVVTPTADRIAGSEVTIDADTGAVTLAGPDATSQVGPGSELPQGFPDELPLPDDLEVLGSTSRWRYGGLALGLQSMIGRGFDAGVAFMDDRLPSSGWTVADRYQADVGDLRSTTWAVDGHGYTGTVSVTQIGDEALVDVQVALTVDLETTDVDG